MKGRAIPTTSYDRYRRAALTLCRAIGLPVGETAFDGSGFTNEQGERYFYVEGFIGKGATRKDALAGLVAELRLGLRGARAYAAKRAEDMDVAEGSVENLGFMPMMDPVAVCARCEREWTPWEWAANDTTPRTCVCGATVTPRAGGIPNAP